MASIEQLKSIVSAGGGFASANQYYVQLPEISGSSLSLYERNVLCRATRLPGRQILTNERVIGIQKQQIAMGHAIDDSITLSFHVLNDYKTKDYFDKWQNLIVDQRTQQIRYANEYKKSVKIYQLSKGKAFDIGIDKTFKAFGLRFELDVDLRTSEKIVYGVELLDAFPITMNGIDLSDAASSQTLEVSISLSYRNWNRIK